MKFIYFTAVVAICVFMKTEANPLPEPGNCEPTPPCDQPPAYYPAYGSNVGYPYPPPYSGPIIVNQQSTTGCCPTCPDPSCCTCSGSSDTTSSGSASGLGALTSALGI